MKRKRFLLLLGMICLIVMLATLSPSQVLSKSKKFPLSGWPKGVICAGGSPGSSYYTVMVGIAQLSSKYLKVRGTVMTTATGSGPQVAAMSKREADFGTCADIIVLNAVQGIKSYAGKQAKNLRAVVGFHQTLFNIVTNARWKIKKMEDLKGSGYTVTLKAAPSSVHCAIFDKVYEFYGIDPTGKDVKEIPHSSKDEAFSGLREGRFQVICEGAGATGPIVYWVEMDRDIDMRMIPLSLECIEYVGSKIPGVVPGKVAPGLYKGVPDGCVTAGICSAAYCIAELPDDYIYELCKLVFEPPSREEWLGLGPHHELYTTKNVDYLKVPYHAGAVKYYKEIGAWTDKAEKQQKEILGKIGMEK